MGRAIYRNKGSKENIVISIAGAHGVGKSTVFSLLKRKSDAKGDSKLRFFPERYIKKPPFPFGSSDKQIAFRSEIHFLQQFIKRNQSVSNFDEKYNGRILILDRTPLCVLIYSKSLNLKEKDYNLILDTYRSVKWKEDYIIYLSAKPETILRRIIQRGSLDHMRKEWNEYEKNYLLSILSYYNQFLLSQKDKGNLFVIDTDRLDPEDVVLEIEKIIFSVAGYSFKTRLKTPKTQMNINKFF
ncbi:MAG: deoxynucleoside kinase [Candidatus Lokiarchaeota archaeon]|nr:deoxynucleoside kinase [Candidatus Lokiarchaeota archaeon]